MSPVLILRQWYQNEACPHFEAWYQNEACPHFEAMISNWSLSSFWGNGIKMKLVLILRHWYQNEACHHFEDVASKWRLSLLSGYNRESVILEMISKHEMGHFHLSPVPTLNLSWQAAPETFVRDTYLQLRMLNKYVSLLFKACSGVRLWNFQAFLASRSGLLSSACSFNAVVRKKHGSLLLHSLLYLHRYSFFVACLPNREGEKWIRVSCRYLGTRLICHVLKAFTNQKITRCCNALRDPARYTASFSVYLFLNFFISILFYCLTLYQYLIFTTLVQARSWRNRANQKR